MNHQSTLKTFGRNFVWVILFLGAVSTVTALRRSLRHNERFTSTQQAITSRAAYLTPIIRSLLVP